MYDVIAACIAMMTVEAESFGWWLDRSAEDVGHKAELVYTEQQAAGKCWLHSALGYRQLSAVPWCSHSHCIDVVVAV